MKEPKKPHQDRHSSDNNPPMERKEEFKTDSDIPIDPYYLPLCADPSSQGKTHKKSETSNKKTDG